MKPEGPLPLFHHQHVATGMEEESTSGEMAGRGVVSRLVCAVTPSLAAPTAMSSGRRHSFRHESSTVVEFRDVSKQESLGDRASSKLTLDDELFDILCAFGETETFLGAKGDQKDEAEEEGKPLTRQALLERIREKKEVIGKLRCQGWSMARKRRTLKLAQKYLEQHESKVSKSHLYMEELRKRGRLIKRHFSNFKTYLIPWEGKIKKIESHFGSVVSSYFTFLRWIVFVNVIITLITFAFVVLPESLADSVADPGRRNRTDTRKQIPPYEKIHADEIAVVWHYDGYLRYSPLFYGYYGDDEFLGQKVRYALPLAYFLTTIFIFAYSFFAILRKMAMNARMSKISGSKTEQYIFNWRVFTGWDYTIGNSETAANTVMAVVIKLRESIADIKVDATSKFRCLQFTLRVIANIIIFAMLAFSIYCITFAVQKSQTAVEQEGNLFTKNQVPSVVATITHVFPMIFDLIGRMENYHPRTALRAHLARVLVLYVLNYLTLIVALFDKMDAIRNPGGSPRTKRQMGDRNPNLSRPPPYASRQFSDRSELLAFVETATKRFDVYRTTRQAPVTPVTITPQYGPLNVNNPQALLRNATFNKSFESSRVGPAPLPIFTPPPRPPRPYETGSTVRQQFGGPDFPSPRTYTRITAPPRVRTTPPWDRRTEEPPATITQPRKETSGSYEDYTDAPNEVTPIPPNDINDTLPLPEPVPRRSNVDEMGGHDICWETIIGQEIVKLVTMDLIVTIVSILLIDFLRGLWIRHCASWWCWDIETTFPEYGEFKVAENVLHIINNQGMIWLGLFFAPLLPALNNIKLIILMYIRGWAVMTCNVPAREIFRASRSSNFYLMILLLWLLLCTIPVGFVIASTKPSRSCGPFARYDHFYTVVTREIEKRVDATILGYLKNVASPGIVIPILLFLVLIIYFLVSLVRGLREANTDLQQQLIHERTEEKKKIFELAGGGKKRQDENRDRGKKTMMQYLPLVEQRRRETWRTYHELEEEPQRASDSSSSEDEDGSEESPEMLLRTLPPASSTAETVAAMSTQFHPSLASLVENEGEEEEGQQREATSSSQSRTLFESPTNVVDIATPEEIRSILRPLLEMKYGISSSSKAGGNFPRDIGTPPTMIVSSRSKRNSFISLYDLANMDSHIPTMMSTQVLRGEERAEVHRNSGDMEKKRQLPPRAPSKDEAEKANGSKFDSGSIKPDFQPWPSIDEVKQRKEQLLKRTPLALNKQLPVTTLGSSQQESPLQGKPPVPLHRRYQQIPEPGHASASETDGERSVSPTRRFRISVSPTRRLTSEERDSSQKRIYSIKQESATVSKAPSTASIPQQPQQQQQQQQREGDVKSPRAPRVEFGDDDSPRVQ